MTKLKLITAAVVAATFVSPVFAQSTHHHRHHHHHRHFVRQVGPVNTSTSPSIAISTPFSSYAYGIVNVNSAKSWGPGINVGHHLSISGVLNVDAKYASRGPLGRVNGFDNNSVNDIYVNNANLFFDADINPCICAHIGLAYLNDSVNGIVRSIDYDDGVLNVDNVNFSQRDGGSAFLRGNVTIDEAYVTIADFVDSPFYLKVGKAYADFGYNPDVYPLTYTLTQLLSQTRGTIAQGGIVTGWGVYGDVYALSGVRSRQVNGTASGTTVPPIFADSTLDTRINNFGAKLGYKGDFMGASVNADVDWLYDLRDVDYIDQAIMNQSFSTPATGSNTVVAQRADALGLHGDVCLGGNVGRYRTFDFSGDYVGALRALVPTVSSRIHAWGLRGAFAFALAAMPSQLYVEYQRSGSAGFAISAFDITAALLPHWQLLAGYKLDVLPCTMLEFQYTYSKNYFGSTINGTTLDDVSNGTAAIRLAVAL